MDEVMLLIRVGGVQFSVDSSTRQTMDSDFPTKLTAEDYPFGKPDDGVYKVDEADPECFSALLNWFRHGSLPVSVILHKGKLLARGGGGFLGYIVNPDQRCSCQV
jgi:hypothetical protein